MNDYSIQTQSSSLSVFYQTKKTEAGGGFEELLAALEKPAGASEKNAANETTARTTRTAGRYASRVADTTSDATATQDTTQSTSSTSSGEEVNKDAYVFRPGFFETLMQQVRDEIAAGNDPEKTLDGSWRNFDSLGNELPEPIPLNISGGWEYNKESSQWEWSGGENPYDLYWLDDAVQAGEDTGATTTGDTVSNEETSGERERIAFQSDSPYRFRAQFFETIIGMVANEIAMGRDPSKTLNSDALQYDSYGNKLPKPIPLDMSGSFAWNEALGDFEWTGGEDPYTLYWLTDEELAQASAAQAASQNTAAA